MDLPLRFLAVMMCTHVSFTSMRLALTLAALQQQASPLEVGIILSLLMVVPVFTSVAIGRWTDRAGHVPPSVIGMGLTLAGGLLAAGFPGLVGLGGGAVLIGSGQAMVQVAMMHAIGRAPGPRGAAQAFSALSLGYSISGFVGPVATGVIIDQAGHQVAFFALCVPAIAGLVLALRDNGVPDGAGVASAKARSAKGLLADPEVRAVLITTALLAMSWDLFTFVMPLHASRLGLSATAIGTVAGCFAAGSFSIRLVLGRIAARFGEQRILFFALTATALCYAVFPFATAFPALAGLAYTLGLVLGSGQPMAMSLLHRSTPAERSGEAMGVRTVIVSISQTTLPLVFGALGAVLGTAPVFWAVAALVGGGVAYSRRP